MCKTTAPPPGAPATARTRPDFDHYYFQGGIRKNFFGPGYTAIYGEYGNSEDAIVGNGNVLCSTCVGSILDEVTSSELEVYGVGIVQRIDAAAAVLFEIGWAVVRSALDGDSQIPLERALTTLNQIVGLGLLPRRT